MRTFTVVTRQKYVAADGTEFIIREPSSSDAKAMMRYINSVIREKRSGIIMDRPVTLKQEQAWLKDRLQEIRKRTAVILLAETGGRVVGNCHASRRPWKERHRASIGIALVREARGKGLGRALMSATMDLSIKRMTGLESFDLSVLDYNETAQRLYGGLGFVEVGTIPKAMKEDGEYTDEKVMIRFIEKDTGERKRTGRSKPGR
jgi:RimJ/RimL family protein N-acetyltransferase